MTISASLACQALLTRQVMVLGSPDPWRRWPALLLTNHARQPPGGTDFASGRSHPQAVLALHHDGNVSPPRSPVPAAATDRPGSYLNLEFNIPLTGLEKLESLVGLPDFSAGSFSEDDYAGNQTSHFREHFASQIVLRRLSVEFHTTLSNGRLCRPRARPGKVPLAFWAHSPPLGTDRPPKHSGSQRRRR